MSEPVTGVGGVTAAAPAAPRAAERKNEQGEGFERMLLGQLTKTLVDSSLPSGEGSSAAMTAYKDMLPDALTEALMSGGGIGLAAALQEESK